MKKENRLVVADIGWAESIPEWVKEAIREERMINGLIGIMSGEEEVGDAEVLVYLYTANLRGPISHYLSEVLNPLKIYLYFRYQDCVAFLSLVSLLSFFILPFNFPFFISLRISRRGDEILPPLLLNKSRFKSSSSLFSPSDKPFFTFSLQKSGKFSNSIF